MSFEIVTQSLGDCTECLIVALISRESLEYTGLRNPWVG
jgi:hypothetical protein